MVSLPPRPAGLQHERVHPGADVSWRQADVLRDAAGQAQHLGRLLSVRLVFRVLPEMDRVAAKSRPPTAPVPVAVDVRKQGQKPALLNLRAEEKRCSRIKFMKLIFVMTDFL